MKIVVTIPDGTQAAIVANSAKELNEILLRNSLITSNRVNNKWWDWLSEDISVFVNSNTIKYLRKSVTVKLLEEPTICTECGQEVTQEGS